MCGIAGILTADGRPAELAEIQPITRALAHRGPDGEGIVLDGPIALGHRRLAILDVSDAARQPMRALDNRYVIVYNGEIFNFLEIRSDLEKLGHRFRSTSDTEVVVHAFHEWGADCVLKFNGLWAFAIWDRETQELFLSRDHFGIKPLMYLDHGHRFVFASELKSFLHLRGFSAQENSTLVHQSIATSRSEFAANETLIESVMQLPAGHNMTVGRNGRKMWRWWNTVEHVPEVPHRFSDQVEQFRELFFDAVRVRLRSDVPLGTCLSGGVDSTAVLCTMAEIERGNATARSISTSDRAATDWQRAFVATFPGTHWDERKYAEVAIQHSGALDRFLVVDKDLVEQHLHQFAYDFETIGRALVAPIWCIYRHLREDGVVVSLDGQGADELLSGYTEHVAGAETATPLLRSPLRRADLTRTRYGMYGRSIPPVTAARSMAGRLKRRLRGQAPIATANANPRVLTPPWDGHEPQPSADDQAALADRSALDRMLYSQFHSHLPNLLRFYDRLSMAHGVESRMPFMDWRLVTYSFGLPDEAKIGGGFTKRILRESMRGTMPESLRTRKLKTGFTSPMPNWFNAGLDQFVQAQIAKPSFADHPAWDATAVREFVAQRAGHRSWSLGDCYAVWPVVQANLWHDSFFVNKPALADDLPAHKSFIEHAISSG